MPFSLEGKMLFRFMLKYLVLFQEVRCLLES